MVWYSLRMNYRVQFYTREPPFRDILLGEGILAERRDHEFLFRGVTLDRPLPATLTILISRPETTTWILDGCTVSAAYEGALGVRACKLIGDDICGCSNCSPMP